MMFRCFVFLPAVLALATSVAFAQPTQEADPLQCWWRTSAPAIHVGETFSVVLTCAVLETDAATIVVDQSKLEPSVVQFAPFEVLGGSYGADLRTDLRRFFQYEYRLRLIAENEFGKDVALPETKLSYRVQSRVGQNAAIQGRDQSYVLPARSIRVLSLVPGDASDIRDTSAETFADLDQRGFRANLFIVVGGVLFALAGLFLLLAVVRLVSRYRKPAAVTGQLVTDRAILGAAGRELTAVRRGREAAGWSAELAARALTALRIAATYAFGRRVAQSPVADPPSSGAAPPSSVSNQRLSEADGVLMVRSGWRGGKRIAVSGAVTARTAAHEIARGAGNARHAALLESLHEALAHFTAAQYGRDGALDDAALDQAVTTGLTAVRRLKLEHTWIMKRFGARRPALPVETRAWSR